MEQKQAEFIDLLLKVTRRLRANFDARVSADGLTLSRARTLLALKKLTLNGQGLYQKDLAEELGIENATLVRLLDALEQQGLVVRDAATVDRRAKNIALTAAGWVKAERIHRFSVEMRAEILSGINNAELEQVIMLLAKVSGTMMAHAGGAHNGGAHAGNGADGGDNE